tara:strand:+ start:947 stop:1768 length:822 start_codon:yes stop_codon:yes gene_type:complete
MKVSGYIPTFNNERTIADAINSLKQQSYPIDDIFVIDDGSIDQTASIAQGCGIEVHLNSKNMGRGYTRSRAMELAKHEYVVCCDATNELDLNFVKNGVVGLRLDNISSVFGRISSKKTRGIVNKWRSIHLFKENVDFKSGFQKSNLMITYGAIMRKSHIMEVGNFDPELVHSEDEEITERLLHNGYTLLSNHDLKVYCNIDNTLIEVLERYWRWYIGKEQKMTFKDYLHSIKCSIKPMIHEDLKAGYWGCILISLLCPHYSYFKTLTYKRMNQ